MHAAEAEVRLRFGNRESNVDGTEEEEKRLSFFCSSSFMCGTPSWRDTLAQNQRTLQGFDPEKVIGPS